MYHRLASHILPQLSYAMCRKYRSTPTWPILNGGHPYWAFQRYGKWLYTFSHDAYMSHSATDLCVKLIWNILVLLETCTRRSIHRQMPYDIWWDYYMYMSLQTSGIDIQASSMNINHLWCQNPFMDEKVKNATWNAKLLDVNLNAFTYLFWF